MERKAVKVFSITAIVVGFIFIAGMTGFWIAQYAPISSGLLPPDPALSSWDGTGPTTIYLFDNGVIRDLTKLDDQEQRAIEVIKEDSRVQELMASGIPISYIGRIESNPEDIVSEPIAVVGMESGNKLWQAAINLNEYTVISVMGPFRVYSAMFSLSLPIIFSLGLLLLGGGVILLFRVRRLTS